jgi:hypothetical protein
MKENGMGGSLYGRDDMDEMMSMYGNGGDGEEEGSGDLPSDYPDEDEDPKGKFNDMEF